MFVNDFVATTCLPAAAGKHGVAAADRHAVAAPGKGNWDPEAGGTTSWRVPGEPTGLITFTAPLSCCLRTL